MKKILMAFLTFTLGACGVSGSLDNLVTVKDQKMGIATKNPDELLTVNGSIHAKEVRVDLDGALAPDYVFSHYNGQPTLNNYQRIPLDQLEDFVRQQGHLPGVPTHEMLTRDGLDLKAFSLTLLEKIEELSLYLIEQQMQIDTLQKALDQDINLRCEKKSPTPSKYSSEKVQN